MGSSSCAPTDLLVRFLTARSSGGRLPGRPAGRALHQPEECAIFLFPHEWGRHPMVLGSTLFLCRSSYLTALFICSRVMSVFSLSLPGESLCSKSGVKPLSLTHAQVS